MYCVCIWVREFLCVEDPGTLELSIKGQLQLKTKSFLVTQSKNTHLFLLSGMHGPIRLAVGKVYNSTGRQSQNKWIDLRVNLVNQVT